LDGSVVSDIADSNSKIDALTGLRWFAALAVVFDHNVPGGKTPRAITQFFMSGSMGVTVFFVLSGFVLAYSYEKRLNPITSKNLVEFYVNRLLRVYPLYLLAFCVVVLPDLGLLDGPWFQQLFMIQTWNKNLDFVMGINAPSWSVSVEVFFYLCFPLILAALRRIKDSFENSVLLFLMICAILIVGAVLFQHQGWASLPPDNPASAHRWLYRSPIFRLSDFVLGIATFKMAQHCKGSISVKMANWIVAGSLVFILISMASPWPSESPWKYDALFAIPSAVGIFGLVVATTRIGRILGWRPFVMLGECSYAFYILMAPVALFDGPLWFGFTFTGTFRFVFDLLIMILISYGAHVLIEEPARKYVKDHWIVN